MGALHGEILKKKKGGKREKKDRERRNPHLPHLKSWHPQTKKKELREKWGGGWKKPGAQKQSEDRDEEKKTPFSPKILPRNRGGGEKTIGVRP